ncbi:MAG TPA: HEAT repeat domain-containing protein [Ktedonobacteraceae bacterium]|nr:HEAT repeat domain-containing protein [Ktedonobacteraceae bacterium]
MPRGRKGPPQDSIDSILLAMSRRSDVDPDTLSHYLDRLDEEWTSGAREKVLHLLRTSDPKAHSAATLILSELATDFDLEELEDFVADPTVGDLAKLSLAPVLKELDSELADDGIIDYLNDPEAAMLQMQIRLLELVGQSELGVESILEDVLSMPVERRLGFIGWLGSSQDPRAAKLLVPLLENQSSKVVLAAMEALEQLGAAAAEDSIPALNYLLANSSNRQVKQQARVILGRLTMLAPPDVGKEAFLQLPLHEARVSFVDGAGAQMVMLSWSKPDGLLKGVNLLCQDEWGIKDCYGTDEMAMERWQELIGSMDGQGFISFKVPLDYCRALIVEARQQNKRARHKLPVAYSVWRPLIESSNSSQKDVPASATMIEPQPFNETTARLAAHGDELYNLPEFDPWLFEPFSSLHPYINSYLGLDTPRGHETGRKRKGTGRLSEAQRREREALVDTVLERVIDTRWRLLYDTRLRRQARLFQLVGREEEAQLIGAVAAALHPDSGVLPQHQPFLRALVHRSLERGLIHMMAEMLENVSLRSSPLNFFNNGDDYSE